MNNDHIYEIADIIHSIEAKLRRIDLSVEMQVRLETERDAWIDKYSEACREAEDEYSKTGSGYGYCGPWD